MATVAECAALPAHTYLMGHVPHKVLRIIVDQGCLIPPNRHHAARRTYPMSRHSVVASVSPGAVYKQKLLVWLVGAIRLSACSDKDGIILVGRVWDVLDLRGELLQLLAGSYG